MVMVGVGVRGMLRHAATTGMFLYSVPVAFVGVLFVPVLFGGAIIRAGCRLRSASTARAGFIRCGLCLGEELLPAMLAAKIMRLSVALGL
jgi:hypothetical protein